MAEHDSPILYAGQYYDAESGMYYLRARYYSPDLKRFTQEDPIRDGMNWYAYCSGNPVSRIDVNGLAWEWIENIQSRINLTTTAFMQYKWLIGTQFHLLSAVVVNARISTSIYMVEINKGSINKTATKYGVPNELIGAIIFKEQLTKSLPDTLANVDMYIRGAQHSTGLGAIFPSTARNAWSVIDPSMVSDLNDEELQYKLSYDNQFNIATIAAVLIYEAIGLGLINDPSEAANLTISQWQSAVAKYNGSDEYARKVYQYLTDVDELLD